MSDKLVPGTSRRDGSGRRLDGNNGPIGFFGGMQGATPKYAKNVGEVSDDFRGSMARFFINSATSVETRLQGLPKEYASLEPVVRALYKNGYIDFILQGIQTGLSEKLDLTDNLSGGYVAYYLGTSPQVLQCSGVLINSLQDDQVVSMVRLYAAIISGTKLAEHGETLKFRFDSFMYSGYVNNLQWSLAAENELYCPFSFTFLVKKRIEIPSTFFKPVPLDDSQYALPENERGAVDAVGPVLVPQKTVASSTGITTPPVAASGAPPNDTEASLAAYEAALQLENKSSGPVSPNDINPAFNAPDGQVWNPFYKRYEPASTPRIR